MISVQEASSIILSHPFTPSTVKIPLTETSGRILAESIFADRDLPPFDRVTMDGIAIAFDAWKEGKRSFSIAGVQAAGEPAKEIDPASAIEVMTGAVLPRGADTVVPYEDLTMSSGETFINSAQLVRGQNVHKVAQDVARGSQLLSPGTILSPAEVALLASVGKSEVLVYNYPRAAVVSSGDELIGITEIPAPHQLRRSNTYAVEAAMRQMSWPASQFHFRDEKQSLLKSLSDLVAQFDVVILSGGVSKGKFDFVPTVLEELGVKKKFHQVSQRPGKPFWFGVTDDGKTVFALPGNPVSTFMCFYRYIRPWFFASCGVVSRPQNAILATDFSFQPRLTYYLQVRVDCNSGKRLAYPEVGGGSGDFANLRDIDGFLELPPDRSDFHAGEAFPYIAFRE